jgi:hypothetical protein
VHTAIFNVARVFWTWELTYNIFSADKLSARGIDQSAVVLDENSDNSAVSSLDTQNDQNSDPDGNINYNLIFQSFLGTENPLNNHQAMPIQPTVDPQIRHIWSEAIDLSEVRNSDDQAEFRSLLLQLGIDVSFLNS